MLARVGSWLRSVLRRRRLEREMADEMAFHIAARAEELHERGLAATDALRQARIEFGAVERYKEECRESLGLRLLDELRADLRFASRQLLRTKAFSLSTIAILGVGIGASTALFSTADAVLLRLLPVERPQELRRLAWLDSPRTGFCESYNGSMHPAPGGRAHRNFVRVPGVPASASTRSASFSRARDLQRIEPAQPDDRRLARLANGQLVSGNFLQRPRHACIPRPGALARGRPGPTRWPTRVS